MDVASDGREHVDSYEFYQSPEFQALCERFGIFWNWHTTVLTIRLPGEGEPVVIEQHYRATELKQPADTALKTTTLGNPERWVGVKN